MLFMIHNFIFFFFFFQAEDGIRDLYVTGVQTCALPISVRSSDPEPGIATELDVPLNDSAEPYFPDTQLVLDVAPLLARPEESCTFAPLQIGRASCRERV